MTTTTAALTPLSEQLGGRVALPGSAEYARLTTPRHRAVPVSPAAVVAAADAADVVDAVRAAAQAGLQVSVRATGHGARATGEDVLLVVTAGLDECVLHPDGWVRVGAGVTWQRVVDACAPHGLAPLCGSSLDVGVVGYTTGGGLGPMARTFGLAGDRVRALEVVTADGVLRRVTPDVEPDLFWALRGGKGAVGVVTAIEMDLVRVAAPYAGSVWFDGVDAGDVLHAWHGWSEDLPDSATTSVALLRLPALRGVPPLLAGRLTVAVRLVHVGAPAVGAALLDDVRAVAPVLLDGAGALPVSRIGEVHGEPSVPLPVHEQGVLLRELTGPALDTLLEVAEPGLSGPLGTVEVRALGGAVARGGAHASAVCHRDQPYSVLAGGPAAPPVVDSVRDATAAVIDALAPWSDGATLPNWCDGPSAYDAATLARLRAVADRYDPGRVMTDGRVRLGR